MTTINMMATVIPNESVSRVTPWFKLGFHHNEKKLIVCFIIGMYFSKVSAFYREVSARCALAGGLVEAGIPASMSTAEGRAKAMKLAMTKILLGSSST